MKGYLCANSPLAGRQSCWTRVGTAHVEFVSRINKQPRDESFATFRESFAVLSSSSDSSTQWNSRVESRMRAILQRSLFVENEFSLFTAK